MKLVDPQRPQRQAGDVIWSAAICLGIGDNDVAEVLSESEHTSLQAAQAWVEVELPQATFPDWVYDRRHGTAGAFICGHVDEGLYTYQPVGIEWEPRGQQWAADLRGDVIYWQQTY